MINELVKPASVIASHANEVGTVGGKVRAGSKTEAFIKAVKAEAGPYVRTLKATLSRARREWDIVEDDGRRLRRQRRTPPRKK